MKTINYFCILLLCLNLTYCSKNQHDLDKAACAFVEATIRLDKETLLSLVSDSTAIDINQEFIDLESKVELIQEEIKKYSISTQVVDRDINEKDKYAIISVKMEIKGKNSLEKEFLIPFRYIDERWLIVSLNHYYNH